MIQLIYSYSDEAILKTVLEELVLPLIKIPEMSGETYLTLIETDKVSELEDALDQAGLKLGFVGSYNMDGSQFIWTEPTEIKRNHTISNYKSALRNKITRDENGEVTSDIPYTEVEAKDVQVLKIYGLNDRDL